MTEREIEIEVVIDGGDQGQDQDQGVLRIVEILVVEETDIIDTGKSNNHQNLYDFLRKLDLTTQRYRTLVTVMIRSDEGGTLTYETSAFIFSMVAKLHQCTLSVQLINPKFYEKCIF